MRVKNFIIGLLMSLLISVGYGAVVLNSCGTVAWVGNTTYLVNITSPITSGTSCFNLPLDSTGHVYVKFLHPITIDVPNDFAFFYWTGTATGQVNVGNITIENANITAIDNGYINRFIYAYLPLSYFMVINNVSILDSNLINFDNIIQSYTTGSTQCGDIYNVYINNTFFIQAKKSRTFLASSLGAVMVKAVYGYCYGTAARVNIYNSFLDTNYVFKSQSALQNYIYSSLVDSTSTGYIFMSSISTVAGGAPTQVRDLMGVGYGIDANHDGFVDSSPATNRVWLKLRNFLFYQDTTYGSYGFEDGLKFTQVYHGYDNLVYPNPILNMINFPSSTLTNYVYGEKISAGGKNATTKYSIILNDHELRGYNILKDTALLFDYAITKMNGIVAVTSNSKILDNTFTEYNRSYTQFLGNANYISNYGENTVYNDIEIANNTFYWKTQWSDRLISLDSTNTVIEDNIFNTTDWFTNSDPEFVFDLFNSNDWYVITKNIFDFPDTWTTSYESPIYLFQNGIHVKFYNNYVDNRYIYNVSDIPSQPIELNTTVGYYYAPLQTIYYFNIGNYWTANLNCTDANSDGICDAPYYLDNGYVDYRPLAVYPYVYSNHLLSAISTSYVGNAGLVIDAPLNNSTVSPDVNGQIALSFTGSNLPSNNYCSLYIDGILLTTLVNIPSGVEQTVLATGWSAGWYNLTVVCGVFGTNWNITNTSIFYVNTTTTSTTGTVTTATTSATASSNNISTNILGNIVGNSNSSIINTNSVDDTTSNVVGLTGDIVSKIFSIGILSATVIIVILLVLGLIKVIA